MKIGLLALQFALLLTAANACAQEMPYHPYRKVQDRYYDLRPIYSWYSTGCHGQNPMPEWFCTFKWGSTGWVEDYRVIQVASGGLFIQTKSQYFGPSEEARGTTEYRTPLFLTNYPYADRITEGKPIVFIAMRAGVYRYADTQGASHAIELFDYGIPYSPWELKAGHAPTNSPVIVTNVQLTHSTNVMTK